MRNAVNAKRAANKVVILSFDEHEKILRDTLVTFGLRSEVPFDSQGRDNRGDGGSGPGVIKGRNRTKSSRGSCRQSAATRYAMNLTTACATGRSRAGDV